MTMPWDRFQPEEPHPELPFEPPALPQRPEEVVKDLTGVDLDYGKVLADAFADALRQVRDESGPLVRDSVGAITSGQPVEVVAKTSKGKQLVVADARSRSFRTFLQGLGIDIVVAIIAVLATLTNLDPFDRQTWILLGALLIKTVVQTAVSYVMRLRVTPTVRTRGEKMAIYPLPVEMPPEQDDRRSA